MVAILTMLILVGTICAIARNMQRWAVFGSGLPTFTFHRGISLSPQYANLDSKMNDGLQIVSPFPSRSAAVRRVGKFIWFIILIAMVQSSLVDCATFTTKAIGQSTPIPGAINRISVTLISDADLRAASGSVVTISGLTTAIASSPIPLLDVGDNYEMIFSDGTTDGHGVWSAGTLTLMIRSGATLNADTTYAFAFDITNPATANTSPTIYIEASGTTSITSSPMTMPNSTQYGVRNGANPLQVEVPVFNTKSIERSTMPFVEATTWKVTLNSNYAFSSGSTVTISGLTGSQTPESTSLNVTSTDSKLGSSGDWTQSSGTLVLAVDSRGTIAEKDYMVTFSLPNWAPTQFSPTVKVMAAMQDSGSIAFVDMTYMTAEPSNIIVLSHPPYITSHMQFRRSERIVKNERMSTLSHQVENRDKSFPAIIAGSIAPTEGPISKGSLVLLGISSASALLHPDLTSSLKFRVQDFDNDNNFAYGTIVAGPLSLADWKVAESPEYDSFVRNTANFSQGSNKLVKDYQNAIQSATSFADSADGGVVALLVLRTPNWMGACMVQAVVEYDGHELEFDFEFWEADPNLQIESVHAQNGRASGSMAGGYPLSVSISGFPITHDIEDISIVFGSGPGRAAQVLLLEQSDRNGTKMSALVPIGHPGVVQVVVSNHAQGSSVSFEFEYLNDSISGLQEAGFESSCLAPHLHKSIRYNLSVHTDVWKDTQPTFRNNQTTDIRVVVSTRHLMLSNFGRSWLHTVEVRQMTLNETSWLSEGVTLNFVQYNCSQLIALPMGKSKSAAMRSLFFAELLQ